MNRPLRDALRCSKMMKVNAFCLQGKEDFLFSFNLKSNLKVSGAFNASSYGVSILLRNTKGKRSKLPLFLNLIMIYLPISTIQWIVPIDSIMLLAWTDEASSNLHSCWKLSGYSRESWPFKSTVFILLTWPNCYLIFDELFRHQCLFGDAAKKIATSNWKCRNRISVWFDLYEIRLICFAMLSEVPMIFIIKNELVT